MMSPSKFCLVALLFGAASPAWSDICYHPRPGRADFTELQKQLRSCAAKKGIAIVRSQSRMDANETHTSAFHCYSGPELTGSALPVPANFTVPINAETDFKNNEDRASVYVFAETNVRAIRAYVPPLQKPSDAFLKGKCFGKESTFLTVSPTQALTRNCHDIGFRKTDSESAVEGRPGAENSNQLLIGEAADRCIEIAKAGAKTTTDAHVTVTTGKKLPAGPTVIGRPEATHTGKKAGTVDSNAH